MDLPADAVVHIDPDRLQRQLRGRGRMPLAILWCRLGAKQRAFICRRAEQQEVKQ